MAEHDLNSYTCQREKMKFSIEAACKKSGRSLVFP